MTCDHCHQGCVARYIVHVDGIETGYCYWCRVGDRKRRKKVPQLIDSGAQSVVPMMYGETSTGKGH